MSTKLLMLAALALAPVAQAAQPTLPRDGWVSWHVATVDEAPAWCCFDGWKDPVRTACKLDTRMEGYGIRHDNETTDTVTIYAKMTDGKLERLQPLAASCPVEAKSPVQEIQVAHDDSVRWLVAQARVDRPDRATGQPIDKTALAALALHRGDAARDAMTAFARDARVETRKMSVFWLSMLRGAEGAEVTSSVMFNDANTDVREHAAFALAQSKTPRVAPDLIRLGNTDKSGEVRSRAWFWLAQKGAPEAEAAISAAIRKDADDNVREQAIFALSQLPDERAAKALIAAAEDQSLPRETRKKAVFWLSMSGSDSAQAYLEKVLARNAR